ncbi:TetR/AcrR family transcriptional regulator [Georgenia ruanii]|uniref:TetR family transcriptional regulator n=1 Tax=Georgenia ruanii TaxID=348442 RepID=A0A7J9V0X6_9MICO|nr:TetR family transcriptional regulator [Georgenia ruanii]MPV90531.1 TetR family transcriptional regulator [Georgenia ruanii]
MSGTPTETEVAGGRKNDPLRKQRITEAAARVIAERGIDGLTFRSVALAAKVPLGSTTYYFADKDELVTAAISVFRERSTELFRDLLTDFVTELGLAGGVAALVEEMTVRRHSVLVADYRIYLSLLGRPQLASGQPGWDLADLLRPHCSPATARLLSYVVEGILIKAVMEDVMVFAAELEPLLRRITDA